MVYSNKSFCIVCIANYCRSPVAEYLLRERFKDKYEFFSAGISPIAAPSMDSRSIKFLKENSIDHNFHTPKKINNKILDYFDIFLAVDFFVLNKLNFAFPKYRYKFKLLSSQFSDINIIDPFKFDTDEYSRVMNDLKHVTENINLKDI